MAYNPKDFYFKKAKAENYAARSVFKLEEMDKRFRLFRSGDKVLDLGCAPGSWSQYASQKVTAKGAVLGIDLQAVKLSLPNAKFLQGDAFNEEVIMTAAAEMGIEKFDLVLSDMAPKTTGIRITDQERSFQLCKHALDIAVKTLKPHGHFVVKIFQGDEFKNFTEMVKDHFKKLEILRPKSVRQQSFEIYVLGLDKK